MGGTAQIQRNLVATRILGLLITAIGVQFFLSGLAAVTTNHRLNACSRS